MKKILFVMLPFESATGICTLNVARELVLHGYQVDILTYKSESEIDLGLDIKKYEVEKPYLVRKIDEYKNKKHNIFELIYKINIQLLSFRWPLYSIKSAIKVYKKVEELEKENEYDVVIPVYANLDAVIAGHFLKKKYNVQLVPYFLDSISAGGKPKILSEKNKIKKGIWWESILLNNADGIIFMESSKSHHKKYNVNQSFWNKCIFMDIPSLLISNKNFKALKNGNINKIKFKEDCLNIVYVGTLPLGIRDPRRGLEILKEVANYYDICIYFIGPIPSSKSFIDECNSIIQIKWVGNVSHECAKEYIKAADILLNFGNTIEGMVPSKIFEYMSFYKSIISFAPSDNDPSIQYIKKYPLGCLVYDYDNEDISVSKIIDFIKCTKYRKIDNDVLYDLFYENTPNCFCEYIESITNESIT